jgi:hypothetical protein
MTERLEIPEGYTPGPWIVGKGPAYEGGVYSSLDGRYICSCVGGTRGSHYEHLRIAALIALAPAMADEIKRLREENAKLRTACQEARDCLTYPEAGNDGRAFNILDAALNES